MQKDKVKNLLYPTIFSFFINHPTSTSSHGKQTYPLVQCKSQLSATHLQLLLTVISCPRSAVARPACQHRSREQGYWRGGQARKCVSHARARQYPATYYLSGCHFVTVNLHHAHSYVLVYFGRVGGMGVILRP
jgi:hypothetical protein